VAIGARFLLDERYIVATREKTRHFASVITRYSNDVGALPSALTDLLAKPGAVPACSLNGPGQKLNGWCGPYIERVFAGENTFGDAWGTALVYSSSPRQLRSYGPDRLDQGGGGDDLVQGF